MTPQKHPSPIWALVRRQHGVISRQQLIDAGYSADAIRHRVAIGRLHPLHRGVYAVGRPDVSQHGRWMAAVLAAGRDAVVSHVSAAGLWGIRPIAPGPVHVSVRAAGARSQSGIAVHKRSTAEAAVKDGIPVSRLVTTLIDLACVLRGNALERAVNEADRLGLIDPETLRRELADEAPRRGKRVLADLLDAHTFRLTDSDLEQRFLRLVRKAGLRPPETGRRVCGFKTDFFWPELGLIVETDGLRYHRTPAQQARDRRRDQVHAAAGLVTLRFTHDQVAHDPAHVVRILRAVASR